MNEKLVSIIVAIYNSEPFIKKCVESIIMQSYSNLEIVLVDDGSPDNSGAIIDEYAQKDARINVIHKNNGGACEARNCGIKASTGDYLVIVDGDDWLELDYVEYMMCIIDTTKADMALSDHIFTTRDRIQIKNDYIEVWSAEEATCKIIYPHMEIGPWNKIYSRKLIIDNNISFSVPWSGEGLYFACTAAQYSNKVGVGHKKVYNYRLNNTNSGLTNYNVQMGINALENIRYIDKSLIINTKRTKRATQWHIWKNYNYLLFLIVATKGENEYKSEYSDCLKSIRRLLPKVVFQSELPAKTKLGMVYTGLFPIKEIRRIIKTREEALAKDNMK